MNEQEKLDLAMEMVQEQAARLRGEAMRNDQHADRLIALADSRQEIEANRREGMQRIARTLREGAVSQRYQADALDFLLSKVQR